MRQKDLLIGFLFFLVIFTVFTANAQDRNLSPEKTLAVYHRPLQFGNELFPVNTIQSQDLDWLAGQSTRFEKDYRFQYLTYNPERDWKRLGYNFSVYVGAALASYGILWMMPESVTGWDKDSMRNGGMFERWLENVKKGPVWDTDSFYLNWIMHPWIGGIYYMSARGSGFKPWESFAFSFAMSTFFWEYGIEAFAEVPSWQDIILTPTLGSLIGEGFFHAKKSIIKNERKVLNSKVLGGVSLFLIDPINMVVDAFGYPQKNKVEAYSYLSPVGMDMVSGKPVWGMHVSLQF